MVNQLLDTEGINMKIINTKNNAVLSDKAKIANTFLGRLVGLLNRSCLVKGEALILKPSWSIHTLFMRFSIDVIFVDKEDKVIAVHYSLKPFRLTPLYPNSSLTIELPENTLESTQTHTGDILKITP